MRVFIRITLLCLCAIAFHYGRCEELDVVAEDAADAGRTDDQYEQKKDGKSSLLPVAGGMRRPMTQNNGNATRDSQLLSLLRNRRRQMFSGRLASHINTIASLASKANKNSSTFAQLEIRDSNNSLVKKITLDNVSSESPTIKLTISNGTSVIQQNLKPQEVKQIFIPKLYQDNKSRAGFLNNRKKLTNDSKAEEIIEKAIESGIIYIPPEGLDKEVILEPDEEFQVDESNHGLYLLNYSDTENVSVSPQKFIDNNATDTPNAEDNTPTPLIINVTDDITTTSIPQEQERAEALIFSNSTENEVTKLEKIENDKDKNNNTLFISDDISNHFRPLETGVPLEEMAPFINFGQKLGGPIISDNLTNTPSFSASTKSINFIVPPPALEKRKFNSRYSATEKYRNTSVNEEEVNEDMDVSVVKNVIEKNKVRNTVKGPAPARHVGLVNAYRKYPSTTPSSAINSTHLNTSSSNNTEPFVENTSINISDNIKEVNQINENRTNTITSPKNLTRNYFNIRRRPSKISILSSTENTLSTLEPNTTTEKASTVYTAVVTSVSITSSMKGQNKNETVPNLNNDTNTTVNGTVESVPVPKAILINSTESSLPVSPVTPKQRHRIRIRTTTTESSLNTVPSTTHQVNRPTVSTLATDLTTNTDLKSEATSSKLPERLVNLFRQNDYESSVNGSTIRPKNILKRRRPTTTTTTTTIQPPPTFNDLPTAVVTTETTPITIATKTHETTVPSTATTPLYNLATEIPKIILEPSSKQQVQMANASIQTEFSEQKKINVNATKNNDKNESISQNEEVVIEAEKNYTASYVLAGLGFLPVAAIVAFILRNVLNKKTKELDTEYEGYFEDGDIKKESPITPVARPPVQTPSKLDQKWEFPRNKLRLQTLLGQGNFGQVWKAEADDLNGHDGLTRLVAVKTIKETASQKEKQELLHEIYIMQKIGTHPNVVTLLACCSEQEPYLLIMEYVMCGKLLTYLRERRSRPDRFSGSGALTSRDLTVFAYCVARGMDYITSKGIVHRDLAARNILVDHNKLCKVADFGMSRAAGGAARGRHALPVRWMAPEALLYNVYSHQTDVWAFGILLWEIVTLGSTPYAAMSGREVLTAVTEGYRLERPPHCKPQLYRAMHSCWHADPSQRPTFSTLKSQLADLLDNEISEGNYVDLDSFYQESSVYSDPSAIIHDEEGLSAEYDRERRVFRELNTGPAKFDNRSFNLHDEELRNKFGIGTPRMGGFGIRDLPFNDRNFSDGEFNDRNFPEKNFTERNFTDKNFNDTNFAERKDGKLSTSSFHRDRDRENPLVSRNSFNGFPRIGTRENHFQMSPDGRNKRVSEFECDI